MTSPAQQAMLKALDERWQGANELLADRMGIEFTDYDPNNVVVTMPVAGNRQLYGLLHGGASAVLAESPESAHRCRSGGPCPASRS
jgi:acyl-coenzyme A thioesterase PaaI-like protein